MGKEGASEAADLPIEEVLDDVVAATRERGVSVLVAPPGAGKTTRVPPALLRAGLGPVVVLEPRRIAARAAARRVAEENGWHLGGEVGDLRRRVDHAERVSEPVDPDGARGDGALQSVLGLPAGAELVQRGREQPVLRRHRRVARIH